MGQPAVDRTVSRTRLTKKANARSPRPNLTDYAAECSRFKWTDAWALLDGLPDGRGYNIAHEAVDRHAQGARAGKTAIRWLGKAGERRELTYGDLATVTNRFANALTDLGVQPGERVFVLMGRTPELYVAVLGALKARCVVSPLFSAFGPEPIATRLEMGDGRVLVTAPGLYRRKIEGLRPRLPGLRRQGGRQRRGHCSSELTDPTITITSLGERGADSVIGVIYPPQVAIVGFGRIAERPWVADGEVTARPLVSVSLSADHRASDGQTGGKLLAAIGDLLQEPEAL